MRCQYADQADVSAASPTSPISRQRGGAIDGSEAGLAVEPRQRRRLVQSRPRLGGRIADADGGACRRVEVTGGGALVTHGAANQPAIMEQGERRLLVVGESPDEIERVLERVERLPVRQPARRIAGRPAQVRHGTREIAPALEVLRQLGRHLTGMWTGACFLVLGDRQVKACPLSGIEALVADVPVHPVNEPVAGRRACRRDSRSPPAAAA